jgi:hypothetical protein
MNDAERILGRLQEFKDHTSHRLDKIEKKLDVLHEFKWRIAGGVTMLSVLVSIALKLILGD